MAITKTIQTPIARGDSNSMSYSITLAAGDVLLFAITNRAYAYSWNAPAWNGQTMAEVVSIAHPNGPLKVFSLKAEESATANLTSATSTGGFTVTSVAWVIFKSSTQSFSDTPFRDIKTLSYSSGTYADPSVTLDGLAAGDNVAAFLGWLGWGPSFSNVQSTTATENNLAAGGVVQNSNNLNTPGRMYISTGEGYTGSTVVGYNRVGAGDPMHTFAAIAVYESSQLLTIATDLTPGSSRTDACTGFPDGAATISFSGVSVPVTVSSNSITWTVPALADGATWPRIPSTGTIITLTQGELSANATGNITLPPGYNTLRVGDVDGGVPANFSGIVTDDPKFLGYHLTLTTSDTWYNPAINGLKVYRNGDVESNEFLVDGVTLALPRTDAHFQQDASGLLTLHNVTMTPAGGLIVETPGLTAASLTMTGLTMRGLTMSGL